MPQRRPYNRWTASEKERLFDLRQRHLDMSLTKFTNTYYADRDPRALSKVIKAQEKKIQTEEKARANRDNVTPTAMSTTTGTSSKSPERVRTVEARDDDIRSSPEPIEDILISGQRDPHKRIKLTYSTRSQAASSNPQWSQDPATIQSESSERPKSLDQSTLVLSPQLRKGSIVPFSVHANRNSHLGATNNDTENLGLPHSTPPPPPPSVPPPSTPPPPLEQSREGGQAQNHPLIVAVEHSIRQSETQDQSGNYTPKEGLMSTAVFRAQKHQWCEWMDGIEAKYLDQEKKLKEYESMQTDKDIQIFRLQTERDQLMSDNMRLRHKLRRASEFLSEETDDLGLPIAGT